MAEETSDSTFKVGTEEKKNEEWQLLQITDESGKNLQFMVAKGEEAREDYVLVTNTEEAGNEGDVISVLVGGEENTESTTYVLQLPEEEDPNAQTEEASDEQVTSIWSPENLLRDIFKDGQKFFDFPIFCQDGVAWSNKIILASLSPSLKNVLETSSDSDTCLIIPELKKQEVSAFHQGLFVDDFSLDFYVLLKVAKILGAELPSDINFESLDDPFPCVNYENVLNDDDEHSKLLKSLGYCGDIRKPEENLNIVKKLASSDVTCEYCDRKFVNDSGLKKHINLLHKSDLQMEGRNSNESGNFECPTCKKSFRFAISFKKHQWMFHSKGQNKENKAKVLRGKSEKKIVRKKEKSEEMSCKVCGYTALTWRQLQTHMMDHTKERPFKCNQCHWAFKEPQKLKRHMLVHSGEKKHECKDCGRKFSLKQNLKVHELKRKGCKNSRQT